MRGRDRVASWNTIRLTGHISVRSSRWNETVIMRLARRGSPRSQQAEIDHRRRQASVSQIQGTTQKPRRKPCLIVEDKRRPERMRIQELPITPTNRGLVPKTDTGGGRAVGTLSR